MLPVEPFAKALQIFETCVLINDSLCGKLVSPSPIIFDERFNVSWVPFCIPDFNLLSCELDELYIYIELFNIISKQNKLIILLQLLWKIQNSFFCFFNNEKHCCISCSIWISARIDLLCCFRISIKFLLFT